MIMNITDDDDIRILARIEPLLLLMLNMANQRLYVLEFDGVHTLVPIVEKLLVLTLSIDRADGSINKPYTIIK